MMTDEWISNIGHIHRIEYYAVLKRKKILTPATIQMKAEDTVLKEMASHKKAHTTWFHSCDLE